MRPTVLILLLILFFVSCGGRGGEDLKARKVRTQKDLVIFYILRGNHQSALRELEGLRRVSRRDPEFYYLEGLAYFGLGEYEKAETSFKKAVKLNPDYSEARTSLGGIYLELGRWDDAIRESTKAAEDLFYRSREKALTHIGYAYFKKGDFETAKKYFKDALEKNPAFVYTHNKLGELYLETGETEKAVEEFKKAVEGYDPYDEAHYNLGLAYLKMGKMDDACREFRRVLELAPKGSLMASVKTYIPVCGAEGGG